MKQLLILLTSCFVILEIQAQDDHAKELKGDLNILPKYDNRAPFGNFRSDSTYFRGNAYAIGNRKPGVYRLPLDNMPCFVPDSTKTVRMPNAWKGVVKTPYRGNRPRIPNLSTRPEFLKNTSENTVGR